MSKKLILILVIVFSFYTNHFVLANVIINEVQLLPTEERFIELYNDSSEAVSLTDWYIQRKTATGSNFGSLVSKTNFEGKTIDAHDYFVISKSALSNSKIVLSGLTLTESNTIQIKNSDGEIADSASWESMPEGQSAQKTENNSWINATPTPGTANKTENTEETPPSASPASSDGDADSDDGGSSSGNSAAAKTKTVAKQKIRTEIAADLLAYVGIPFVCEGRTFGSDGQPLFVGKYFWNFGDGDFRETAVTNNEKFTHTYFYPGEYTVLLQYYPNYFTDTPDASQKISIKVVVPEIVISSVGDEKDFFVELANRADYVVDLSNWYLTSDQKNFIIPRNTTLSASGKMIISSRVTGFTLADKDSLKLFNSEGGMAFAYGVTQPHPQTPLQFAGEGRNAEAGGVRSKTILASAINTIPESNTKTSNFSLIFPIIFLFFIGISAGAVYFIRQKKVIPPHLSFSETKGVGVIPKTEDDFEILDE